VDVQEHLKLFDVIINPGPAIDTARELLGLPSRAPVI
jgi:hypothetical protein